MAADVGGIWKSNEIEMFLSSGINIAEETMRIGNRGYRGMVFSKQDWKTSLFVSVIRLI